MPVKYECPKCGRRFVEWGAEKLGYQCPNDERCSGVKDDEIIRLLRVGASEEEETAPSLKRKPAKKAASAPKPKEEEAEPEVEDEVIDDEDDDDLDEDDSGDDEDADVDSNDSDDDKDGDDDGDDEDDSDDHDAPEDLDFENKKPSMDDNPIKEFDE